MEHNCREWAELTTSRFGLDEIGSDCVLSRVPICALPRFVSSRRVVIPLKFVSTAVKIYCDGAKFSVPLYSRAVQQHNSCWVFEGTQKVETCVSEIRIFFHVKQKLSRCRSKQEEFLVCFSAQPEVRESASDFGFPENKSH